MKAWGLKRYNIKDNFYLSNFLFLNEKQINIALKLRAHGMFFFATSLLNRKIRYNMNKNSN